jgi:hypothetical protein
MTVTAIQASFRVGSYGRVQHHEGNDAEPKGWGPGQIHIAAEQPKGVPGENWLPITREDLGIDVTLRVYVPDLKKMKTWKAPMAEPVSP